MLTCNFKLSFNYPVCWSSGPQQPPSRLCRGQRQGTQRMPPCWNPAGWRPDFHSAAWPSWACPMVSGSGANSRAESPRLLVLASVVLSFPGQQTSHRFPLMFLFLKTSISRVEMNFSTIKFLLNKQF